MQCFCSRSIVVGGGDSSARGRIFVDGQYVAIMIARSASGGSRPIVCARPIGSSTFSSQQQKMFRPVYEPQIKWYGSNEPPVPLYEDREAIEAARRRVQEAGQPFRVDPDDVRQIPMEEWAFAPSRKSLRLSIGTIDGVTERPLFRDGTWSCGKQGRGAMWRWGVNQCGHLLLTRGRCPRTARPLEFLAIRRASDGLWQMPGGFVRWWNLEHPRLCALRCFILQAVTDKTFVRDLELGLTMLMEKKFVHVMNEQRNSFDWRQMKGDSRCTDNAWIETVVTFLPLSDDWMVQYCLNAAIAGSADGSVGWVPLEGEHIYEPHHTLIRQLC